MDQIAVLMIIIIFEYCEFNIYMSFLGNRNRCINLNGTFRIFQLMKMDIKSVYNNLKNVVT